MFDLLSKKEALTNLLIEGVRKFELDHPCIKWSCVAFDSCPWMGWVALNFDTTEKSNSIVSQFQHNGPAWYCEDENGRFNNNCTDFKYCEFVKLEIPEWYETYDSLGDDFHLNYIDSNGQKKVLDLDAEGDEGLNKIVFPLLKSIMTENRQKIIDLAKNRDTISRLGVQMCDSECEYFESLSI